MYRLSERFARNDVGMHLGVRASLRESACILVFYVHENVSVCPKQLVRFISDRGNRQPQRVDIIYLSPTFQARIEASLVLVPKTFR